MIHLDRASTSNAYQLKIKERNTPRPESGREKYELRRNFVYSFLMSVVGIHGRALRKRRGLWPDILAPGGNTFAAQGYYGMQTNIAYPESGIPYNPNGQGWNPYFPGYPQQNPFNNFNPYGYNQPYQYPSGPGIPYGGFGMNNGVPYNGQVNYNGYYPPVSNIGGPMRSGLVNARAGGNIGGQSPVERNNIQPSLSNNPTNK